MEDRPGEGSKRILCVDDDEPNRRLVVRLFERYRPHDRVTGVSSAAEAIERARDEPPDLVLLDLTLGDVAGDEVLRTLKAEMDVPVIIVSGHADLGTRKRLLDAGADGYIAKPVDVDQLFRTVSSLIASDAGNPS